ncbi:MAG: hypothetical protein BGO11_01500 [Solirubrobacterales bacterium 70-9]|nr:MAG: hypothetical protein BGO11_01500 [Solirubrobacterales bacterium 70-9]
MYLYRGYILGFVLCFSAQLAIFNLLERLGVKEGAIWTIETLALFPTVWITMALGERFERK